MTTLTQRLVSGALLGLAALLGCVTPAPKPAPKPEPVEQPRLRDAGERLWVLSTPGSSIETARLRLTRSDVDAMDQGTGRCPGPFLACARRASTWNAQLRLSLTDERTAWSGTCALLGLEALEGTHVCDGDLEGLKVSLSGGDEEVQLRLLGNDVFPGPAPRQKPRLVLQRIDPVADAVAAVEAGQNRSAETRHLAVLVGSLEAAAAKTGFGSQEALRAEFLERGVDPRTVPQAKLRRLVARLREHRPYALRLDEAARQALFKEMFDGEWVDPAPARPRGAPPAGSAPTDGDHPPPGATVHVAYGLWSREGQLVETVPQLVSKLDELSPRWRAALADMSRGEVRRLALAAEGHEVELRLLRFAVLPAPPETPNAPPEGAALAANGLRYVVLKASPGGERPMPNQSVRVRHTGWNANGRVLRTTAWEDFRWWNSLEFVGDASLEVGAAHLLRVGEKGVFWIPAEHPLRAGSRRPNDETAVFEVELLEAR